MAASTFDLPTLGPPTRAHTRPGANCTERAERNPLMRTSLHAEVRALAHDTLSATTVFGRELQLRHVFLDRQPREHRLAAGERERVQLHGPGVCCSAVSAAASGCAANEVMITLVARPRAMLAPYSSDGEVPAGAVGR